MNKELEAADKALKPLIRFTEKTPGAVARITERLTKLLGKKAYRQEVEVWLHPDPAKRIQPRFGKGLLLLQAGRDVMPKKGDV